MHNYRYPDHCYRSWPNAAESIVFWVVVCLPFIVTGDLALLFIFAQILGIYMVDVGSELFSISDFQHRCSLLKHKFPIWYLVAAHLIANIYVIALESGRLYGHVSRGEVFQNACRRFEWHCGKLPHARERFVRREAIKFVGFVLVAALNLNLCLK
ncbi:hypothetical protein MPSEU_000745900 [Mayamaea pseudoterrestris]|nr:hypothetical protein MPSEU_000745900 [Mayamaea pseudoterrestris]